MNLGWWLRLAVLFGPAVTLAIVETFAAVRAANRGDQQVDPATPRIEAFDVIVPIYGSIRYLENVEYLRQYGSRVLLTTTTAESPEFDAALDATAAANGFRVFRGHVPGRTAPNADGKRCTGGTIREHIVRQAVGIVDAPYVVCIDADTETDQPLSLLVGALEAGCYDVASVRLVAKNRTRLVERLQAHEYRNAMRLRLLAPWLVSGACHALRTRVHREVMNQHSTCFQGNDVEVGVLGDALRYRVGHVPFDVPTTVPATWRAWWRQRLAWSGGEVRLYVVNLHLARRHPAVFLYGFFALATTPLRWWYLINPSWAVLASLTTYLIVVAAVNWRERDRALLVMPLYLMLTSLVIVPLGVVTYAKMAWADRKMGLIRKTPRREHRGVGRTRWVGATSVHPIRQRLS